MLESKLHAADVGRAAKSNAFFEVAVTAAQRIEGTGYRIGIGDGVIVELSALPPPAWVVHWRGADAERAWVPAHLLGKGAGGHA